MIVVTVARKPSSESTVAKNVLIHGTGGINIDGARISHTEDFTDIKSRAAMKLNTAGKTHDPNCESVRTAQQKLQNLGRWPANFILSKEAVKGLDAQSGIVPTGTWNRQKDGAHPFGNAQNTPYETWQAIKEPLGGASRFFKVIT